MGVEYRRKAIPVIIPEYAFLAKSRGIIYPGRRFVKEVTEFEEFFLRAAPVPDISGEGTGHGAWAERNLKGDDSHDR